MMKFFRKYNKQLLAVFMVLLMIVFIGGSALTSMVAPEFNPVVATSKYGKITRADQNQADAITGVLTSLGFAWRAPLGGNKPLTVTDWILITEEAKSLGMYADKAAARAQLADFGGPDRLEQSALRLRCRPDYILAAVGQLRAVQQAGLVMASAVLPSAAEIRTIARDALSMARIRAVVLPAQAFLDEDASIPDSELEALLKEHGEKEPGTGLNFGYFIPTSVKAQYIKLDRDKIADQLGIPNLEREARRYYDQRRDKPEFARPEKQAGKDAEKDAEKDEEKTEENDDAEKPAVATGDEVADDDGEESPEADKPALPYLTWDEAKDKAIDAVRKQHADEVTSRIAEWIIGYTTEALLDVPFGDDGYKVVPEQFAALDDYDTVLTRLPRKLQFPDAVEVLVTDFFNSKTVGDVPVIGKAWARDGKGAFLGSFKNFALQTKAIFPTRPAGGGARSSEYIAPFQTCSFQLSDNDGNRYVFRLIDELEGHPAATVDEVRDELVTDARLMRAWNHAKNLAEALAFAQETSDLQEAYDNDIELEQVLATDKGAGIGFHEPEPFPRVEKARAALGRAPTGTFITGLGRLTNEAMDRIFELAEAGFETETIELPERATILVVEALDIQDGRQDEFDELGKTLGSQLASNRRQQVIQKWFDPEQIRARSAYQATDDR